MWKNLFLAVGISIILSPLQAQHNVYVGFRAGFHASTANITHTIFGAATATSQVFDGEGGLMIKYFAKHHYGLQLEVNYTRKGFDQLFPDTNEIFNTQFNYLEIPFMFNLYLGNRKTQYFANFGPYVAVLMDHEISGPQNSNSENLDFLYDPQRDNKTVLGIKLAAGIFREFSFGGLQVDGFFSTDFSNFLNPVDLSNGVPDNSQNIVFGVSVAYLIPLGRKFEPDE